MTKFENEADLSAKIVSKLPCIKSCNKVTVLKDFDSVVHENLEDDKSLTSSVQNAMDAKFYLKIPNPPDEVFVDMEGQKFVRRTEDDFSRITP
jgi:hypothetical protein